MKNSGNIVEKAHFSHLFTVTLALISNHAPTIVKWSARIILSREVVKEQNS